MRVLRGFKRQVSLADRGMMMGLGKRGVIGDRGKSRTSPPPGPPLTDWSPGMMMGLGKRSSEAWQDYDDTEY